MTFKEKYKDTFLVERIDKKGIKKITAYFLLKNKKDIDMDSFMKAHKLNDVDIKNHPNEIMDFYNDMIKFQNQEGAYLNYITIFAFSDKLLLKYMEEKEEDNNFVKWVNVNDIEWLDKIKKYYLSKQWFNNADGAERQYRL